MAGIFQNLPYANFHELNLDWVIEKVRETMAAWEDYKTSMDEWKLGVDDELAEFQAWFDNLDVQDEVRTVINELIQSGEFIEITGPQIVSVTEAWLAAHVTPTTPPVDNTLSISGAAADAKVTGDRITDLTEELSGNISDISALQTDVANLANLGTHKVAQPLDEHNQPTDGTNGQSLRTKGDGTTEWADTGLPTDEQTAQAVNDWLGAHPEATTTVVDGSLTEAKFSNSLKLKTIKDYVTPEMFGAVGDGATDDTAAVQAAFDDGNIVLLTKTYYITSPLQASKYMRVIGSSSQNSRKFNLKFDASVHACIICDDSINGNALSFDSVGFYGINLKNQGLFVSLGSTLDTITLINCAVTSFDAVLVGNFNVSRISDSWFYRIARAFSLAKVPDDSFSYQDLTELLSAIEAQSGTIGSSGLWESSVNDCYISGQGAYYKYVGLFVGGNPIDIRFSNCYIDYWSAYVVDAYTGTMGVSEPIVFSNCNLDSIITFVNTTKSGVNYTAQGIHMVDCLITGLNSTFNNDVNVPIYDFLYDENSGIYKRFTNIKIKNCRYKIGNNNPSYAGKKFINLTTTYCELRDCYFDFVLDVGITIDDVVTIAAYYDVSHVTKQYNKLLIFDGKVYDSYPTYHDFNGRNSVYNGQTFIYANDLYMVVNETIYKINNA